MLNDMVNPVGEHGAGIITAEPTSNSKLTSYQSYVTFCLFQLIFPPLTNQPTGTNQPTQLEAPKSQPANSCPSGNSGHSSMGATIAFD